MVNLLNEVFKDMFGFLVLLLYTTLSFGIILFLLPASDGEFFLSIAASYRIDLGDF